MEIHSPLRRHFLQWRPVCYTSIERNIGASSGVDQTPIINFEDSFNTFQDSIIEWISLTSDTDFRIVQGFNVTFGIQGDGFYKASNYTAWTMVSGHGQPVADQFSLMVMLVIAIGLGLPTCVLLIGGAVIAFRKCSRGKDDLLFSQ